MMDEWRIGLWPGNGGTAPVEAKLRPWWQRHDAHLIREAAGKLL